ncbi:uncharacterized protein ACBT44_004307 isoform 1-T1 [Syngnathus typhle]
MMDLEQTFIRSAINEVLPDLPEMTKDILEETLQSLGVETYDNFQFIEEADLLSALRPIQARKVLATWKLRCQTPETSSSSVCASPGPPTSLPSGSPLSSTSTSPNSCPSPDIDWVNYFIIPWDRFSEELMQSLERGKRPSPRLRREMVRIVSLTKLKMMRGELNGCSEDVKEMVLLLLSYFDEKEDAMFYHVEDTCLAVEVQMDQIPLTPTIVVCGRSCFTSRRFMLSVDQNIVCDNIPFFISALCMLFGSYYCFNIHYPTALASTLEFLQRCFFSINPEKGTKVDKTSTSRLHVNPRVITLIQEFSDHEWRDV